MWFIGNPHIKNLNILQGMIRLKNNYNFDVVKLHLKFNQRTQSTHHKF